ncbi:dsDNA nuclease domain-containing protein [Streptomyces sp. 24-1644]|uniref:dsDNA nuclease domain-containing protein n=1 Tax=Streptomyces sp. 24-1644 TaxID=3457315 RepID=UPI003FA6D9C6
MALAPADGGRRSRRGFAYQDVVTLLDCLDMLDGQWTSVSWEDLEDVLCFRAGEPNYRQVKTIEEAGIRHSVASVCKAETAQKTVETSYLGKLFLGKPLPEGTRFTLVINEMPQRDLHEFAVERGHPRGPVSESTRSAVITRLNGLQFPDGRDIAWCVDRLDVLVAGRTIEDVEREALHRLAPHVAKLLGIGATYEELEEVMVWLMKVIERSARALRPQDFSLEDFQTIMEASVLKATGRRRDGSTEPLMTLREKLRPAEVSEADADALHDAMLAFRRRRRDSIGARRQQLDDLADDVHSLCTVTMVERRSGLIAPGPDAYQATVLKIASMPQVTDRTHNLTDALATLSDITARCLNRYADVS